MVQDLDVAKAKKGKARKRMSEVGTQVFADLRRQAEQVINPMINEKLDEKLSQPFNFQMKEPLGKTSPYLTDAFKVNDSLITEWVYYLNILVSGRSIFKVEGAQHVKRTDTRSCICNLSTCWIHTPRKAF